MNEKLYGLHPVLEAIQAGKRRIECLYLAREKSPAYSQIIKLAKQNKIPVKESTRNKLSNMLPGSKHQGIVALTSPIPTLALEDLIAHAWEQKEEPFLIMADSVQDPHNIGAIIRSAEAVGSHGLILASRQTAGLTPAVAKSAAGALEHLPISIIKNPAACLQRLKESGFWRIGLHPDGEKLYDEFDMNLPLVIIVGGEGVGLRSGLRKQCDWLTRLPQRGHINSLNTSVATALMLYEVRRQRK